MLKQVILAVFTLFSVSLTVAQAQKMSISNHIKRIDVSTLPLFCDKTEVSNAEYRQYTTWVYATFGNEAYEKTLPDSLVWNRVFGEPFVLVYFRHPAYNNYPVVGVSYEQALAYAKWRTDKVNEKILIDRGVLKSTPMHGKPNKAEEELSKIALKNAALVEYRLPTPQEWEQIASSERGDDWGIDEQDTKSKKQKERNISLFNVKTDSQNLKRITFTSPVISFSPQNKKYHHLIGNVAEMTTQKNIAKGGSYRHTLEESKIKNNIAYEKPEAWLGFRCVAVLK